MSDREVGARPAKVLARPGRRFDLLMSKLRRSPVGPGTVARSGLLKRLARPDAAAIVSVVAPAGYSKTTLLAQWADRTGQAFAWVSLDERDNDPKDQCLWITLTTPPTSCPRPWSASSTVPTAPGSSSATATGPEGGLPGSTIGISGMTDGPRIWPRDRVLFTCQTGMSPADAVGLVQPPGLGSRTGG
jgi:hypothetical protein